jgi:acetyl esterase
MHPFFESLVIEPPDLPADVSVSQLRDILNESMMKSYVSHSQPAPELAASYGRTIPVMQGEIGVRVYQPNGTGPFPGHLNFHGGAFWMGNLAMDDSWCGFLAHDARVVVVSVDYRLAPEHSFPVGVNDCYAALEWVANHAAELQIDSTRLSVGGESAGGNFAAVVSLMARDRSGPDLNFQVLNVPVTDLASREPPPELANMPSYLGPGDDPADPYASPLRAIDLSGLPPAHIITAELDGLREQGEAYARRLEEAGVPVTLRSYAGMIHGFCKFSADLAEARQAREEAVAALRGVNHM